MVCWVRNHRRFFLRENQSLQAIPNRLHRAAVHLPQHSTGHAGARPGSGQPWAVTALMVGTAFLPQDTKPSICYPLNLSNGKVWLCGSKWDTETRWLGITQRPGGWERYKADILLQLFLFRPGAVQFILNPDPTHTLQLSKQKDAKMYLGQTWHLSYRRQGHEEFPNTPLPLLQNVTCLHPTSMLQDTNQDPVRAPSHLWCCFYFFFSLCQFFL